MADCFPPESDDFHRRWLPREILADIGIADPEAVGAETPPEAAAAAVEELAAQLAGILGGGAKAWPLGPPPQPPTPAAPPVAAAAVAPCYGAKVLSCALACGLRAVSRPGPPGPDTDICSQVCGLQGSVVVSCGETNGGGAVSWPFVPYPPQLHWQVRKQHQPGSRSPPPLPPFVASFSVFVLGGAPCLAECSAVFFLFFLFRFFFRFCFVLEPRRRR